MYQELNIDTNAKQKQAVIEILTRENLIVAYHGDQPKNGIGICTDGIAAAFIIKSINDSVVTIAHSHYDQLAAEKLKIKIIKNYSKKESTVIFSDTTISKNNFEDFLLYLTTMVPLAFDNDQDAKLNIIFQDHHLGPMQKVITQISYLDNENTNDLPENLTITALENFKRIQSLVKSKKLFFINITSNDCKNNKQPSSELLLELIKPLNILTKEQLFFITSCILAEKISIFSANDKIVRQGLFNFKSILSSLNEQEIIDLLDYIDDKLADLAQKINAVFPFNKIESVNDYSSKLMIELFSSNFITELFEVVTAEKIPLSEKRIKVETSSKPLILIYINAKDYFVATPFPRQSITRSLTLILEKVRRSIEEKLKIKVVAFLLANDSGVVSVIPYNDDVYCKLNDPKSYESQALPAANFIRVGHVNAFVLKNNDGNYSETFNNTLSICLESDVIQNKISKIESVSKYLEYYYQNLKLNITEINSEQETVINNKILTNILDDVLILEEKKLSLNLKSDQNATEIANWFSQQRSEIIKNAKQWWTTITVEQKEWIRNMTKVWWNNLTVEQREKMVLEKQEEQERQKKSEIKKDLVVRQQPSFSQSHLELAQIIEDESNASLNISKVNVTSSAIKTNSKSQIADSISSPLLSVASTSKANNKLKDDTSPLFDFDQNIKIKFESIQATSSINKNNHNHF